LRTVLQTELDRPVTIWEGDLSRKLSKEGAYYVRTINSALNNDAKAAATLVNLMRAHRIIGEPVDDIRETPLTQNDEALLADFFERELEARKSAGG
jgi:hypothetical protein